MIRGRLKDVILWLKSWQSSIDRAALAVRFTWYFICIKGFPIMLIEDGNCIGKETIIDDWTVTKVKRPKKSKDCPLSREIFVYR